MTSSLLRHIHGSLGERVCEYRDTAVEITNRLIRFFRYRLHQPFLNEITERDFRLAYWAHLERSSGIREVVSVPGFDSSVCEITPFPESMNGDLQRALDSPIVPEIHETLLADAQTAILQNHLGRAVLEMALACEVKVKQTYFGKRTPASAAYDFLEEKRMVEVSLINLIRGVAKRGFGQSFKEKNAHAETDIDHLIRCRNKVAHRMELVYRDNKSNLHTVTQDTLCQWWDSVQALVEWLDDVAIADEQD